MIAPKCSVHFHIVFNNTGIGWEKLQYKIESYLAGQVLHCIGDKYYENVNEGYKCEIDETKIKMWFKVDTKDLHIDVIAIRDFESEVLIDNESEK